MTRRTKGDNIIGTKEKGNIFKCWDYVMNIKFFSTITVLASKLVSLKDTVNKSFVSREQSVLNGITTILVIPMFLTSFNPVWIFLKRDSFIPSGDTKFRFMPFLFKFWVGLKSVINFRPIIKRFMTFLVTHFCKSRANFFGKTFVPSRITYTKSWFVMSMYIFWVILFSMLVLFPTNSESSTSTLTKDWFSFHAIHYTFKIEQNQEKSGKFGGYPNVKTRTMPSQAIEGNGSIVGVTTTRVSPNNNLLQENPTRKGRYSLSCMDNIQNYDLNGHRITKLNSIPFSFKIDALSMFELRSIINEGLLDDSSKCLDASVEREFNKCALRGVGTATNTLTLTTNGTTTSTNTSAMYPYHLRKLILELKKRNVPGYSKLGGDYVAIASIYALDSFQGSMETMGYTVNTETGLSMALNGEVGRFYATRFVEDSFASYNIYSPTARSSTSVFSNASAGTGYSSTSWTGSSSGPAYVFGSPTVREAVVVPEEIRQKVVTDYGRSHGLAWYALLGWQIEYLSDDGDNARIIKWDSA